LFYPWLQKGLDDVCELRFKCFLEARFVLDVREVRVHHLGSDIAMGLLQEDERGVDAGELLALLLEVVYAPAASTQQCLELPWLPLPLTFPQRLAEALEGVGGLFDEDVEMGEDGAEVVGLDGVGVDQPDDVGVLVLLEAADQSDQLLVLLGSLREDLPNDEVVVVGGAGGVGGEGGREERVVAADCLIAHRYYSVKL
jgi:hypothetical protein